MGTRIVFLTVVATALICASLSYGEESGVPVAPAAAIDATLYTRFKQTRIRPSLTGMCADLCRAQAAAMAPGPWARSEGLVH